VAESFFRTLKTEWYFDAALINFAHTEQVLFEYIERFYKSQRLYATLGCLTPMEFEIK